MHQYLVVGAGHGIGKALARRLGETHAVWMTSRSDEAPADGPHLRWDVADGAFPTEWLPGALDGVVYCPGTIRLQAFERTPLTGFQEDLDINLLGAVRVLQAVLPRLKQGTHPAVVLFSSVAVGTGMPMHSSIAAAKGAVEGLTRSLAAELAPHIRVNAIAPSLTDTRLAASLLKTDRQRTAAADRHPLSRIGTAEELASAAAFLLSPDAAWISGQILAVDGGMGALRRWG